MNKIITSIGLMSGTSMDGIDVAMIKSDGHKIISKGHSSYYPYQQKTKDMIAKLINGNHSSLTQIKDAEAEITQKHIQAVLHFMENFNISSKDVDIIGFHGQTILHNPKKSITWQIGNPQELATRTGINVVGDLRQKDVICGGQGAPLVPIYHHSLFLNYNKPLLILNIGGVSNFTYLEDQNENNIIASDICFGSAPMDDLVKKKIGIDFDKDGQLALNGKIDQILANKILDLDYFKQGSPKSLDRNHFNKALSEFYYIKLEDALATLSHIIAESLKMTIGSLNKRPKEIIVCGGGRKNKSIMENIAQSTKIKTTNIDDLNLDSSYSSSYIKTAPSQPYDNTTSEILNNFNDGSKLNYDGDMIEAEAFAFLAIRHLLNLPISFKKTTGVLWEKHIAQTLKAKDSSSCGGVFYHA